MGEKTITGPGGWGGGREPEKMHHRRDRPLPRRSGGAYTLIHTALVEKIYHFAPFFFIFSSNYRRIREARGTRLSTKFPTFADVISIIFSTEKHNGGGAVAPNNLGGHKVGCIKGYLRLASAVLGETAAPSFPRLAFLPSFLPSFLRMMRLQSVSRPVSYLSLIYPIIFYSRTRGIYILHLSRGDVWDLESCEKILRGQTNPPNEVPIWCYLKLPRALRLQDSISCECDWRVGSPVRHPNKWIQVGTWNARLGKNKNWAQLDSKYRTNVDGISFSSSLRFPQKAQQMERNWVQPSRSEIS